MPTQRKTSKAAPKAPTIDYGRLYVLTGEPQRCRMLCGGIVAESGTLTTLRYYKGDSPDYVESALTQMSFEDVAPVVVVQTPMTDMLKRLQDVFVSGAMTASCLVVMMPDESLDARTSFAAMAIKHKRVFDQPYIESGATGEIIHYLKEWTEATGVQIAPDCISHLPTRVAKIKSGSSKKEALVYDLEMIETEFDKLLAITSKGGIIRASDVTTYCCFERAQEIWGFVRGVLTWEADRILRALDDIKVKQDIQAALWMLASNLEFAGAVQDIYRSGCQTGDKIAQRMNESSQIGRFMLPDFTFLDVPVAPGVNVWRIQNCLQEITRLGAIDIYERWRYVISALQDMRAGLSDSVVLPLIALALSGNFKYSEPLIGTIETTF